MEGETRQSVDSIMEKVALNQDRALELRSAFVYQQILLIRFKRPNGRTCREEVREFTVTPSARGTQKKLTRFAGKYLKDQNLVTYTEPGYQYREFDLDGSLITDFADDFANDQEAKDSIGTDLFPLTTREQKKYVFTLKGHDQFRDREVFCITFRPRSRGDNWADKKNLDSERGAWSGEILVDSADYQPVIASTHLAHDLPLWVKTLLGTDVAHLGFKVEYAKFGDNLWFPVQYGGEFKLKALFFYKRSMAITMHNWGFQRAQVTTVLSYEEPFNSVDENTIPPSDKPPVQDSTPLSSPEH